MKKGKTTAGNGVKNIGRFRLSRGQYLFANTALFAIATTDANYTHN